MERPIKKIGSKKHKTGEEGQVFVFLVLVIIGVLGFAALGIDGALIYVFRRDTQNAVDSAALASGWKIADGLETPTSQVHYTNWSCSNSNLQGAMAGGESQALARSSINGYDIVNDPAISGVINTQCNVQALGTYDDKFIDTKIIVTSSVPTAFVHLFFNGDVKNSVRAVARTRPKTPLAFGYTIVALNPANCSGNNNGVLFLGTSDSSVKTGGIYSDGCLKANGNAGAVVSDTESGLPGGIFYKGEYVACGGACNVSPAPTKAPVGLPQFSLHMPEPKSSGLPNRSYGGGDAVLEPGIYDKIKVTGGSNVTLKPGLYFMNGNFRVNSGATVTGNKVTIFLNSGDFISNGNANINLSAPSAALNTIDGISGTVIMLADSNPGNISLLGTSASTYTGTVFARTGTIELGGTGDLTAFNTQLIGFNVKIHGTSGTTVSHGNQTAVFPATLNLEN